MLAVDGIRPAYSAGKQRYTSKKPKPVEIPVISRLATQTSAEALSSLIEPGFWEKPKHRHKPIVIAITLSIGTVFAVAATILPTTIPSSSLAQITPAAKTPTAKTPALIKPAPAVTQTKKIDKLLTDFTASQAVPFGIYVKDLNTGATSSNLGDRPFTSASLYKLFIAQGVLGRIDEGKLNLTAPVPGTKKSVQNCLRIMINVSDNTCGQALGNMLGWSQHNQSLTAMGFKNTDLRSWNIKTSANDVGLYFSKLYDGSLLSPASSQMLLGFLKEQNVVNRLPQGLPPGTEIAHKTGDLIGYMNDGGIVYGPKTDYIVVALSGPWENTTHSYAQFKDLSAQLYSFFNP